MFKTLNKITIFFVIISFFGCDEKELEEVVKITTPRGVTIEIAEIQITSAVSDNALNPSQQDIIDGNCSE